MADKNPTWTRDELILALELYVRFNGNPPGKKSDEIVGLSERLNQMTERHPDRSTTFRNPNGVYMKVMNFRRFDPLYIDQGKKGLQRGGKDEAIVWQIFSNDQRRLHLVANAISETIGGSNQSIRKIYVDDFDGIEAEEGKTLTQVHLTRERSKKLVDKKKTKALKQHGELCCEACGFDFEKVYGSVGHGYIEAHHTKPLHTLMPGTKNTLDDLALVCANCHRIIHRSKPWLSVDELQQLLANSQ